VKLNDAQKQVVEHSGSPLLVVAGAGTGKTRVIVEKINKLLDEGVKPESILAVTFTEKAAAEMLDRILERHSGLLLDLPVMTFNGYGHSVLKEFGINIGLSSSVRLLGPQAQIVFVRERIDDFKLDYFLPLSHSPDSIIEDILKLISKLKQNLIAPETYLNFAQKFPETDEAELLEKKKHSELAQTYKTYVKLCRENNVVDYDDQIYLTIELLKKRPNIQQQLQNRYHTIFVDEFQDTNPMQSELIDLLTKNGSNLVVVGDDDQSIYGFRGATIDNILSFKKRYPETKEVVLSENYRSHQSILDASYALIQHNNPNRLEAQLNIKKKLSSKAPGQKPMLKRFENVDAELSWIAEDITTRIKHKKPDEPISIAVLTRSNPTSHAVHQVLERAGVAHRVVGANPDLYTQPAIRMLIELLRTIVEPHNNASLHHTLTSELFGASNEVIAPLASKARHEHGSLENLLSDLDDEKINQALELIRSLRRDAGSQNVGHTLWRAVVQTGYKDRILKEALENEDTARVAGQLNQFFNGLKSFESIANQPTAGQYLESLPALMAAGETTDDTLEISQDEVVVTTIHKAKGLEWDTVYIPYVTERSMPMSPKGHGLEPPEELLKAHESPADEHYQEERRVMYVAMTRAQQNLILSFSDHGKTGGQRKPSRFIDEMFGEGTGDSTGIEKTDSVSTNIDEPVEPKHKVALPQSIYDGKKVRLSVSQAQVLLTCPLNFYYKFVLRAPEEPTTSTDYGSQLHSLFEQINTARQTGDLPPLESLLEDLKAGWNKAGYASKKQQEAAFKQAQKTVTSFYKKTKEEAPAKLVEHPFEVFIGDNIILHGRMDVVYVTDAGVEIRDYKTGDSVKDEKKAKQRAQASQQLTLYALAWQLQNGEIPKVTLEFPDTQQIATVSKRQQSLDTIQQKLVEAVEDMKAGKFPPSATQHDYCLHPVVD